MACAIKLLIAACAWLIWFSISISAEPGHLPEHRDHTLKYKVESSKVFCLGPHSNGTEIKINLDAYVRPVNKRNTVVSLNLGNVDISVRRENGKEISLSKCLSKSSSAAEISRPFLGIFENNGKLRNIKVNRKEDDLSVNIKFLGASLLEIDIPQIRGKAPAVEERKEPTYVGTCTIKNELLENKNGKISVRRTADGTKCSRNENNRRSNGLTCLSNTCRCDSEKNLKWPAELNATVTLHNKREVVEDLIFNQQISYNPFNQSDIALVANFTIKAQLVPSEISKHIPQNHRQGDTVVVSGPRQMKINKHICKASHEHTNDNEDLRQLYSALACQPSLYLYQMVIERAIECSVRE